MIELTITKDVNGIQGWRTEFVSKSTLLPLILMSIDMVCNKIIIPGKFLISNIVLIVYYLIMTYVYQIIEDIPPYSENLNWICDRNIYYRTVNKTNTTVISYNHDQKPCNLDPEKD